MSSSQPPDNANFLDFLKSITEGFNLKDVPPGLSVPIVAFLVIAAFDLRERLEEANLRRGCARRQKLAEADEALAKVRLYLRLSARWNWLKPGQY